MVIGDARLALRCACVPALVYPP